jgi:hypothetical protein
MNCIIQKVPFRLPGTSRTVWAFVIHEREGLSLLLVPNPVLGKIQSIVLAQESPLEHVFESANSNWINIHASELEKLADSLSVFAFEFQFTEMRRIMGADDDDEKGNGFGGL